jgi:hypothetical protein
MRGSNTRMSTLKRSNVKKSNVRNLNVKMPNMIKLKMSRPTAKDVESYISFLYT